MYYSDSGEAKPTHTHIKMLFRNSFFSSNKYRIKDVPRNPFAKYVGMKYET